MSTIGNAPNGENTSLDGTEKIPLSGSKWAFISTIKNYLNAFFVSLSANNTFTGANSFITDVNGASGVYVETTGEHFGVDVEQFTTDSDNTSPSLYLYRSVLGGAGFTGNVIEGVLEGIAGSDSGSYAGDWINFSSNSVEKFSIDINGSPDIPTGQTYNINGSPHTHAGSAVNDSDVIFTDNTTNNSTSDAHGYLPKLSGSATQFLNGLGAYTIPSVADSDITFSDITTGNATINQHGFLPKLDSDSDATHFLNGIGGWTAPASSSNTLYVTGTRVDIKNDNTEQTVLSYSVPGGTLGSNNALRVTIQARIIHSIAGTLTVRFKYGATTLLTISVPQGVTVADKSSDIWFLLTANGATNAQRVSGRVDMQDATGTILSRWNQEGTSAEDSTASKTLAVTVQWGAMSNSLEYDQSWAGIEKIG